MAKMIQSQPQVSFQQIVVRTPPSFSAAVTLIIGSWEPPTGTAYLLRRFVCAAVHGVPKSTVCRRARAPSSTSMVTPQSGVGCGHLGCETPRLFAELKRWLMEAHSMQDVRKQCTLSRSQRWPVSRAAGRRLCSSSEAPEVVRSESCDDRR